MKMQTRLEDKIGEALTPVVLEIENESHKHSSGLGTESHFKVLVVSSRFAGQSRVERQRRVHEILAEELRGGIHALSLRLLTPEEHNRAMESNQIFATPNCQSKK